MGGLLGREHTEAASGQGGQKKEGEVSPELSAGPPFLEQ